MSEVRIYKLALPAAFEFSSANPPETYISTAIGGSNAPLTNYPEMGREENIKRVSGGGASGQNVIDAADGSLYETAWITLGATSTLGPLAHGQWDARGGGVGKPLKCRWKQFFKISALLESDFCNFLALCCDGLSDGTGTGLGSGGIFLLVYCDRTTGNNFDWKFAYNKPAGSGLVACSLVEVVGSGGTFDDAEHEVIVTITPSTVSDASGWSGTGIVLGSTIASDGAVDVALDGVSVASASGIQFVINKRRNTLPDVYYGKTIWHGD